MIETSETSGVSPFTFSYDEFESWYESVRHWRLEPAMSQFSRLLNELLDSELDLFNRRRIRISACRIKGAERLWKKLQDKYSNEVTDCDSILGLVDDMIGLRIVCNNVSDIRRVQALLGQLPTAEDSDNPAPLAIEAESERKYFVDPKSSGYRAYHINLTTPVPGGGTIDLYRAELQVRTLLQDGWGELTHEDTYKPGALLPELARTLARRMADLLATVDELAEDIRCELDRQVQLSVAGDGEGPTNDHPTSGLDRPLEHVGPDGWSVVIPDEPSKTQVQNSGIPAEALLASTREIVESLQRTTPLAAIAHELQQAYGSDIAQGWGGYRAFKILLRAAVPDVAIVEQGPGYVVPRHVQETPLDPRVLADEDDDRPGVLRRIRSATKAAPSVFGEDMVALMDGLCMTLEYDTWSAVGISGGSSSVGLQEVNRLSRFARDKMDEAGRHISRKDLDFLLKALLWSGNLRPGLTRAMAEDVLSHWFGNMLTAKGMTFDQEETLAAIASWLRGSTDV